MAAPRNVVPDPALAAQVRARFRADGSEEPLAADADIDGLSVIRVAAELPVRRATLAVLRLALGAPVPATQQARQG